MRSFVQIRKVRLVVVALSLVMAYHRMLSPVSGVPVVSDTSNVRALFSSERQSHGNPDKVVRIRLPIKHVSFKQRRYPGHRRQLRQQRHTDRAAAAAVAAPRTAK